MKITMYELLGMVKDGKAPKKIKYNGKIYNYEDYDYFASDYGYLFDRYNVSGVLNDEVEIIEEEKKIPEKIDIYDELQSLLKDNNIDEHNLHKMFKKIELKQNEIIDYLKSKGE